MTRCLLAIVAVIVTAGLVQTSGAAFSDGSANAANTLATANDWVPPSVTLTTPSAGQLLTSATPMLAGAAGNASGDGATVTVSIYAGSSATGTALQTLAATRSGATWSIAAATLADGTYTARATQSDAAANTTTTSGVTFTVDATAPAVTLTAPASGSTTNSTTPIVSGAAGDAAGDGATITVKVYAGATATGSAVQTLTTARSGASWSVTASPALADGLYAATATQPDSAGNSTTTNGSTFTIDATPPAVSLTAPAAGATLTTPTPGFSGAAGNAVGDAASVTVDVYAGSTATGSPAQTRTATRSGAAWSIAATTLGDGTYTAAATQADAAGNATTTAGVTFAIDATAPAVTLTAPVVGSSTSATTPDFSGVAGNSSGDSPTVTVLVYSGSLATGTPVQTRNATRAGAAWSIAASPALAEGTYTATATQADAAGNSTTTAGSTFSIDVTAPLTTVTTPGAAAATNASQAVISGSAGNLANDSATVTVKLYAGSVATGTPAQTFTTTRSGVTWTATAPIAVTDGTYTATATQVDLAGNSTTTAARTFTVDTIAPGVTLTVPAAGLLTTAGKPTFSGAAGNLAGDSSTVTVRIYAGAAPSGSPVQTLTPTRTTTTWTTGAITTALADGTYTATATQTDTAGNSTATSGTTLTVDATKPTATDIAAFDAAGGAAGTVESGDTIAFSFSEEVQPASILAGWTGSSTSVRVAFMDGADNDTFTVQDNGGGTTVGLGAVATSGDYVILSSYFTATMVRTSTSPTIVTVTLGAWQGVLGLGIAGAPVASKNMTWTPSAAVLDLAGNAMSTTPYTETTADVDF